MPRSDLEKQQAPAGHIESTVAEDELKLVLECIEHEPVSEDLLKLARDLEKALALRKQRETPH